MVHGESGIDLGRDREWIQRDLYVYHLEMAHAFGDPTDWATFRSDLAHAGGCHEPDESGRSGPG